MAYHGFSPKEQWDEDGEENLDEEDLYDENMDEADIKRVDDDMAADEGYPRKSERIEPESLSQIIEIGIFQAIPGEQDREDDDLDLEDDDEDELEIAEIMIVEGRYEKDEPRNQDGSQEEIGAINNEAQNETEGEEEVGRTRNTPT
jgi:hypothetical protein